RSTVKARLIDPLSESFGEERCAPRKAGVAAGGRHVGLSHRSRDGMPRRCRDGADARVRHWRYQ
ncbi:MAG: hypothetical protein ACRD3W_30300, partial [Terriglobales bacterium]